MASLIVQDLVNLCARMDRESFCQQVALPLLVQMEGRRRFSFSSGGTVLSDQKEKPAPVLRDLVRRGNRQPVLLLGRQQAGPAEVVRLGRSKQNDLVVDDDTVSARHAVFHLQQVTRKVLLQDLASTNGTWVNGNRLVAANQIVLFDCDHLAFGEVSFLFFYPTGIYDFLRARL